ncbi:MAG: endonuclease, partial [Sphingobacteriales bacterium]
MKFRNSSLPIIDRIFLWINYLLCLALLISYLAPITDPRKFWPVAFFGLAYPPLLLLNIIMLFYWALRRKVYFALSLVTILIGYNVLFNNIGFRSSGNASSQPNAIRLMTYNAHNFKPYGYDNDRETKHEMLKLVGDQQPDIISFQEFFTRKRGEYNLLDSMKKIMN